MVAGTGVLAGILAIAIAPKAAHGLVAAREFDVARVPSTSASNYFLRLGSSLGFT